MKHADLIRRSNYSVTLVTFLAVVQLAVAQNAAPIISATAPAKPSAFEVVSIRPSKPGSQGMSWRITPDGYHGAGQSIWTTLMTAYYPQGIVYWTKERLSGAPDWIMTGTYDIDAKVSDADRAAWQKQKQNLGLDREPMLSAMLQTMLADRYKLVAHRVPGQADGYALVVARRGPKLTKSSPGAVLPTVGMKLADGGIAVGTSRGQPLQWSFHSASMLDLVGMLGPFTAHPVVDHTGLSGLYDFVLRCGELDTEHPDSCAPLGGDVVHQWDLDSLGLRLEPVKIPVDTLVIDHIERPSEN